MAQRLQDTEPLDLIAVGRSSVDLYGEQIGGRLEDMTSFAKYVGGSPTNTAIGAARLGNADVATTLATWPANHVVKCLVFYHPDDDAPLRARQDRQIVRLASAARATRHELLLEIIASKHGAIGPDTIAGLIDHFYDLGVYPDWWKLEPAADAAAWGQIARVIETHDPRCRGIVLLGLAAPRQELLASFAAVADIALVKGFAVGRTIWNAPAERWLKGEIDDAEAVDLLAANFRDLVDGWRAARGRKAAA